MPKDKQELELIFIVGDLFMAFRNYIFLIVLVLLIGFLIVSYRRKIIKNIFLRRTANVFTIFAFAFIAFAVVMFPGLASVEATGEYSYTSRVLELTDTSRIENYKSDGSPRKLSVLIYYPDMDGIEDNTCPLIVFHTVAFQRKQAIFHFLRSLQVMVMWLSALITPIMRSVQKLTEREYT